MAAHLTRNFVEALYKNDYFNFENPIVQVLNVKATRSNTFRVIISDGIYFMSCLTSSQLMEQTSNIEKNSLIKVKKCISNRIQTRKITTIFGILLDFDVLPYKNLEKINNPKNIQEVFPPSTVNGYSTNNNDQSDNDNKNFKNNNNNIDNNANNDENNDDNDNDINILPIKCLTPYQNRWTICARAINKSPIKHWSNTRGEGRLFSVVFMDDSSEIKATAFNESCDYLYELIEEGQIYQISGGSIKLANKRFNNCNNEYEMNMNLKTTITINKNHTFEPKMHYSFVPLNQLMNCEKDSVVDVIGVVDQVNEITELTSKVTNRPIQKRDIYIVDDTEYKVRVTLWNKHVEEINFEDKPVVAFKTIRVNDFGGRSLSVLSSSIITLNPDISESHRITGWYSRYGNTVDFKYYTGLGSFNGDLNGMYKYKTLQQISNENLGNSDRPDYFNIIGTITYIKKENVAYPACPNDGCNKKVIEEGDGWRCEKCCKSYPKPNYRYVLNVNILDHTGNQYVTFFNDVAEELIGCKAQKLMEIKEIDVNEFNKMLDRITLQKYDFSIRAKTDIFNDKPKFRCFAQKVKPVNYKLQIKNNINSIDKLMNELNI